MPLNSIVRRTSSVGSVISQHNYTYGTGVELGYIKTWQRQLPNSGGGSTSTTQTFGYDNILQLTSAAETGQSTKTYAYDAAGNRTSKSESGSATTYATANDSNEIASATGGDPHSGASYDDNGNLQSITYGDNSKRTMAWDTINRLKEIIIQAGTSLANGDKKVTWDYNADSQRYKEMAYTHNGSSWVLNTSIYFIWERGSIIQKRIGGTTAYSCTNFFKEGEMRCLNNAAPTKYYYTHDHLGSVYEMTDTAAAVQAAYSYVAYGERIKRWGAQDTEIAYTKHWNFKPASFAKQAAADLSLTWYRAYDTKRGVWLSRDPIEEKGGINLYAYVSNSPINLVNPLGLAQNALHRGSCCNRSSKDEWALVSDSTSGTVKDYWKKLSPGDCVRSSGGLSSCGIDCEGMTCKGKFYAIKGMGFALTATCTDGPDQFPFKDKGWTPGDKSEKGLFGDKLSPGDKSNQVGNTPPGYQYQ